jgi:hypothetical protein
MNANSLSANLLKDKKRDRDVIATFLKSNPAKGFTPKEIANALGWWGDPNKAYRRMAELVSLKIVDVKGSRKCFIGGRTCTEYIYKNI